MARTETLDALASLERLPADETVPGWAWTGRDLTDHELWELSMRRSLLRRQAQANRPALPQARKAGVALAVAAVAAAAAPAKGAGGGSPGGKETGGIVEQLLHAGSRGPAVAALQRQLGIRADGIFGPRTKAAVEAFQRGHGLEVDGIVGPRTRSALARAAVQAQSGMRIIKAWWVKPVQRKVGVAVDGEYGPVTRAAVKRFQASQGLEVDGVVGPRTLAALGITKPRAPASSNVRIIRAWWVAPVQRKLGVAVDGEYGPVTRAAVKRFQASHGLEVDGVVGPRTLAALGISRPSTGTSGGPAPSSGEPSSRAAGAVAAARSAIGRPYQWGGNGPSSFDCSGLMVWSWRHAGIVLPRTSHAQYLAGRPVSRSAVRFGDLVFFNTAGPGASHVGIAISNSSFISATSHGVRVQPIGGSYWGVHYVGARRIG